MTAQELAARLEARCSGDGWMANCPAHEDRNPSLSISEGTDGRVLLHCHAGCSVDSIVAMLRVEKRDLFADSGTEKNIIATYDYTDEKGTLLYQVVRFAPKDFRQRRPDGAGGWAWNLNDTRRVLYHLPQLRAAVAAGRRVFVVEGEKDVAAVERAGFAATCNSGGAGKWRREYSEALKGADVVIVTDKDAPGRAHARQVAKALEHVASKVVIVEPAKGKDVSDHLAVGRKLAELLPVVLEEPAAPRIAGLLTAGAPTVEMLIEKSGIAALPKGPTAQAVEAALRRLVELLDGADVLRVMSAKHGAVQALADREVKYAGQLVAAALKLTEDEDTPPPPPPDADPWPEPVDGATLLTEISELIVKYAIVPPGAAETLAVFGLASHAVDAFNVATYVFLTSPTPECGKTRVIEVAELVVRRPWRPAILTGPVLFRGIEQYEPTLFVDEAEVVRQRSDAADNVRAILHFGYRRGATVDRCVGDNHELHQFRTFGFKMFACIGELPGTLLSRCIVIPMRRRAKGERVARFVPRDVTEIGVALRRKCRRWAADHLDALRKAVPTLPSSLEDRRAEIWEPLFAVADAAGWRSKIEQAADDLAGVRLPETDGVELLKDISDIFTTKGANRLTTADLLATLNALEGQPWADLNRGRGITAARLAKELAPFGVKSGTIRIGTETAKGYLLERFEDAFRRYLPPGGIPAVTTSQPAQTLDEVPESETSHGEACDVSENRDNPVRTGIVTVLRPEGDRGEGVLARTCPKGHPMHHIDGMPADAGWICYVCCPAARPEAAA